MEDTGILYGHLVHFPAISYILWHFSIFCRHLVYFSRFVFLYQNNLATLVTAL
jgi:hypothetical protein